MLNWIVWNWSVLTLNWIVIYRTVLTCVNKISTYTQLNSLKEKYFWQLNCVLMLNWNPWNRTVFNVETVLMLNWIVWYRTVLTRGENLYLY